MKNLVKFLSIAAVAAALASCAKEEKTDSTDITPVGQHDLCVNLESGVYQENGGTKAVTEAVIRIKWSKGDKVSVINLTKGKLLGGQLVADEDGNCVRFSGTVTGSLSYGDEVIYVYPAIKENSEQEDFSSCNQSLASQTYDASNTNVAFYGYAEDTFSASSISKQIQFNLATSYVHLNMSGLATSISVDKVFVSNLNGGLTWAIEGGEFKVNSYMKNEGISVACTGVTSTATSGNAVVRFAVPASDATDERTLSVNDSLSTTYTKAARVAGSYYNQLFANWASKVTVTTDQTTGDTKVVISDAGTEKVSASLSAEDSFVEDKKTEITVGGVGQIVFDETATNKIKENADAESATNVFFMLQNVTEKAAEQDNEVVYEITMKTVDQDGKEVYSEENAEGTATISVPLPDADPSVTPTVYLLSNGVKTKVDSGKVTFVGGILSFEVEHFSEYAIDYTPYNTLVAETDGKKYPTLKAALDAVKNGHTVKLLADIVLNEGHTIAFENNDAFTLDLNGKTISIAETGFDFSANGTSSSSGNPSGVIPARFAIVVKGNGTMNICDNSAGSTGSITSSNYSYGTVKTMLVDGNAVVNLVSGTVAGEYAAFYVVGYTQMNPIDPASAPQPTLNITGGKVLATTLGVGLKGTKATLKVSGGVIESAEGEAFNTNGTTDWYNGGGCEINISGGTFKAPKGTAAFLPAEAVTTITGGTFEGYNGITVKGGTLNITNDNVTVSATGEYQEPSGASSGYETTGICIYVEDNYTNHVPVVNISAGKFSSANSSAVQYWTNKTSGEKGYISLTGGCYSSKPDNSCLDSEYKAVENTDAATKSKYPWKVEAAYWKDYAAKDFSSKSGNTVTIMNASELALFANNVNDDVDYTGYTFKLGADIDLSNHEWNPIMLDEDCATNLTFDGNGKTISGLKMTRDESYTGFFGKYFSHGTVIKGVTISNPQITQTLNADAQKAAAEVGLNYTAALVAHMGCGNIDNCTVTGGKICGVDQVGAIVGYLACGSIKNCTVNGGITISGTGNDIEGCNRVGGITGKTNCDSEFAVEDNTIENATVTSEGKHGICGAAALIGQIMAGTKASWTITGNTITNVTTTTEGNSKFIPIGEFRAGYYQADAVTGNHIVNNSWDKAISSYYDMVNPNDTEQYVRIINKAADN